MWLCIVVKALVAYEGMTFARRFRHILSFQMLLWPEAVYARTCIHAADFFWATVAKWWPNGLKRLATAVSRTSLVARSGGQLCVHCPRREPNDLAAAAMLASHRLATPYLYDSVTCWFSA
jgi:hypothetical protein